ncbi:MAG: amidase [Conexibacter sp.]
MQNLSSISELDAAGLVAAYRRRQLSPVEVATALLRRQERLADLRAIVCAADERAIDAARQAERRYANDTARGPLDGVPFVVKDLIDTASLPTVCGAPLLLAGRRPARDAVAVARMVEAGAVLLGKTATHQFGLGITTVGEQTPPVRNPWHRDRTAGGSSGGSACAVAAGLAPIALGTDTAGSVRIPADFCGVVGLRPTRGAVPMEGVWPLAPTLDQVGPLTRTVADAARVLDLLRGAGPRPRPPRTLEGLRVGVADELAFERCDAAHRRALDDVLDAAVAAGAEVHAVALPAVDASVDVLGAIVSVEALATHRASGLWPDRRRLYERDVRQRLLRAEDVTEAEQIAAGRRREEIAQALDRAFASVDVLLSPPAGVRPSPIAEGPGSTAFRTAVMSCVAPQSLAGLPALVLPVTRDPDGVPVGVQLTAPRGRDDLLLDVGAQLEHAIGRASVAPQTLLAADVDDASGHG